MARWRRARALLSVAFGWVPFAVVAACAVMPLVGERPFAAWSLLPAVGALLPAICLAAARVDPPGWGKAAFLTSAAQLVLGAIPAYGLSGGLGALPLFLVAWVALGTGFAVATSAYRALMLPLVGELGSTGLELRIGVRVAIEHADLITAGVTVGRTHLLAHARRHRPNSAGSPSQLAVPLHEVTGVSIEVLGEVRPWLSLSDGTAVFAMPGPVVVVHAARGAFPIPTDDAPRVAEIVDRRVRTSRF